MTNETKFPAQAAPVVAASELSDEQIYDCWLYRDCMDAIRAGDMKAQFISAARAVLAAATPAASEDAAKAVAYLRFRAAQSWGGSGNHDIECNEWYEVCNAYDIGDDKLPAFPVYAAPAVQQPAEGGTVLRMDLRNQGGDWLATVIAEEVLVGMFKGHRFALHNNVTFGRSGDFTVSHVDSGFHIATGDTPEGAVEAALLRLSEKSQDDIDAAMQNLLAARNQTNTKD